jgi:hypothetical protein
MNVNFWRISRFLLNAVYKHVFPQDFSPAIDFKGTGSRPWISLTVESKIIGRPLVGMGRDL